MHRHGCGPHGHEIGAERDPQGLCRHGRRHARGPGHRGWEHGGGGGGGGRGAGGSMRRFFAHGDLRLVILALIAEKPRHGYELIKAIEERVGGAYSPSPGVIYPTLTLLEETGQVTATAGEGGKRLHAITDEGRAALEANRGAVDALLARMDEAARIHGGGPPAPVMRAMENVRLALRLRLARGPLTEAEATSVAAVLDAAATGIERS